MVKTKLHPNLYVFLVGHPGTGKTRTIRAAKDYLRQLPEPLIAPVSLTWASLVDAMVRSKRRVVLPQRKDGDLDYNTLFIAADELGTLIHKYDKEMADGLSAFYDPDPYGQERRGGDIKIKIASPQINMLCGSTPSNLMETLPEGAWGQGFTSRVIMVFSDERIVGDDFADDEHSRSSDLQHDLLAISGICGEYQITEEFRDLVNAWKAQGEAPAPTHPKLIHYNSRRRVNLYKLCMISAADQSDAMLVTAADFHRAKGWLEETEVFMADIFKAGIKGGDAAAQDEIQFYVLSAGDKGVPEDKLVRFARERVPAHSVMRTLDVMERAGMIRHIRTDKRTLTRVWGGVVKDLD